MSVAPRRNRDTDLLHEQLCAAIRAGRVQVMTDPRTLDFQGSPVHAPWDHLAPLLAAMMLALVVLLSTGVAVGIVAMTLGALAHLVSNRHLVAWRLRRRAVAYMLASASHWQALWQLGGVALVLTGSDEPPCVGPVGDWCKFARRNLRTEAPTEVAMDTTVPAVVVGDDT